METTSGRSRSETRTSISREKQRTDRNFLMWSRPIPSPWHVYKESLMKLNPQTVKFADDAMRKLNGKKLSVNGLSSILGVEWLIAAGTNLNSTMALRFAHLERLPSNNTMGSVNARPLQDVTMNLNNSKQNREERPEKFLTTKPQQVVGQAWTLISWMITKLNSKRWKGQLNQRRMELPHWNLPQPL